MAITYEKRGDHYVGRTKTGVEFMFDVDDFALVAGHSWRADSNKGMVTENEAPKKTMHSLIFGQKYCAHVNGDLFDNRKENLRKRTSPAKGKKIERKTPAAPTGKSTYAAKEGDPSTVVGTTSGGETFLIDAEDLGLVAPYDWKFSAKKGAGVFALTKNGRVAMATLVAGGARCAHVNGDTRDNRKSNLSVIAKKKPEGLRDGIRYGNEYEKLEDGSVKGVGANGKTFIVDPEDHEKIKDHKWEVYESGTVLMADADKKTTLVKFLFGYDRASFANGDRSDHRRKNVKPYKPYAREEGSRAVGGKYKEILDPGHPRANANGYVYEHVLSAEKKLGRTLRSWEVVHHVDGNSLNNDPENLAVARTKADHSAVHAGAAMAEIGDGTFVAAPTRPGVIRTETLSENGAPVVAFEQHCVICGAPAKKQCEICAACARRLGLLTRPRIEKDGDGNGVVKRKKENEIVSRKPEKEWLEREIAERSYESIGRSFGVSGKAVRKWCDSYGLPPRGYGGNGATKRRGDSAK